MHIHAYISGGAEKRVKLLQAHYRAALGLDVSTSKIITLAIECLANQKLPLPDTAQPKEPNNE